MLVYFTKIRFFFKNTIYFKNYFNAKKQIFSKIIKNNLFYFFYITKKKKLALFLGVFVILIA